MTTDKTPATLAEPRSHRWNDVGERCLDCGDKDWMGGPCSGPRKPSATLATVKHGGCVQLATVPYDRARELIGDAYNAGTHGIGYSQQAMELHDAVITAKPSPGGQGVWPFVESPGEFTDRLAAAMQEFDLLGAVRHVLIEKPPALAARQPVYVQGCDELRARTEGERAAYMEGLEEGKKIATRQPVAQVPFAYTRATTAVDPLPVITPDEYAGLRKQGHGERFRALVFADAAPPAQAVDLGKYRHALLRASGWARRSDVTSHAEDAGLLRELLALTGSQAVGK